MSFLSRPNYDYVYGIALQYLQDTNTLYVSKEELQKLVADTMMSVAKEKEKEEVNLEAWNKLTILTVRDYVRSRKPTVATNTPLPTTPQYEESEPEGDPFFIKLQELEVARKSGNVWAGLQTSASAPAAATLATPPVPSESSQVPSVTTVYMQSPPEKSTAIHIRSWHRPWIHQPDRAVYNWSGPFPNGADLMATYVSNVIVPKNTMTFTPYVILEIEGAGGQVNECILIPDSKSVNGTWEYLRPPTKGMGHIRPLALPWTLRFLDADRELMNFGSDHWSVENVQHVREDVSRLTVSHPKYKPSGISKDFTTGEWLLIETSGDRQVRCKIIAVGPDTIDVQDKIDVHFRGAKILHLHRQSCVILESATNTAAKK